MLFPKPIVAMLGLKQMAFGWVEAVEIDPLKILLLDQIGFGDIIVPIADEMLIIVAAFRGWRDRAEQVCF